MRSSSSGAGIVRGSTRRLAVLGLLAVVLAILAWARVFRVAPGIRWWAQLAAFLVLAGVLLAAVRAQHARAMGVLQASEARFRALFEQAAVGIVIVDPEGRIVQANGSYCDLLGRPEGQLVGRSVLDVTHPDDAAEAAACVEGLLSGERRSCQVEKRYVRSDGSIVHARVTRSLLHDRAGAPAHFIGVVEDISERARAATALRVQAHLLDTVKQAVIATDLHGQITYWNRHAERLYGWTAEEALGRGAHGLTADSGGGGLAAEILQHVARGESWTGEFEVRRRDGTTFVARVSGSPIRDATGEILGAVGISSDISDRRALEAQLRQSQKMQAVGQLAGGVAHDFNNLLTVVRAHTQFAVEALPPASPAREELAVVDRATNRAAELTQQLLAFGRKQLLQPRVLDLNATIRGVAAMLRRLISENITVVTHLAPELSPVLADPGQLEQVLVNLVVNARDAMPDGGRLLVETAETVLDEHDVRHAAADLAPGRYVRLVVRDTGTGMDEATQARVFDPFFTTKEPGKGTGLGLATVYGIVSQSGGGIWVESAPGYGTTFEICLPVHRATGEGPAVRRSGESAVDDCRRGSETVLLVEDDASVRRLVRRLLAREGYTVVEARHGAHALEVAAAGSQPFDLVITDMVMPEMSGRALVERLAADRPALRAIFMSGYTDDPRLQRGLPVSDAAFIPKPFTSEALLRVVRGVLDGAVPEGGVLVA
ncbi:MAG TPA: PAS domain S-box protein [Gemmatimonadaceae bacterium]|nr:PAS domain S-box protein [Gemmatimonadaceae bacterium]